MKMGNDTQIYDFHWDDLGDLKIGRPNLGDSVSLAVYRLMVFTFKDTLSKEFGLEKTKELFIKAGHLAGRQFCLNLLDTHLDLDAFIAVLKQKLIELKIGILRIEEADREHLTFSLTVSEDLDCSGLPILGETVCDYDEGFIAGIFEEYVGRPFAAREIDCWATGDRTCRFEVKAL
ncbi:V4R domain-containing protein [Trichloromonas sp.]|uniref:V4R domain-containing protein n=1 Tax=Trichloromonas sp. TaxID=3069249 RepID=UPI002A3BC2E1|nr:V4R domain-containing protein [Trichloromonas sp.]